jgi:hypothetical protein
MFNLSVIHICKGSSLKMDTRVTYLGQLRQCYTNRTNANCVAYPKVPLINALFSFLFEKFLNYFTQAVFTLAKVLHGNALKSDMLWAT